MRELAESYDLVVSSGGIGPTHDDITYESIALAFNRPLVYHEDTMQRMREMIKDCRVQGLSEGQKRMAYIPEPDLVTFTSNLWVPLVQVKNVLILPGVPRLFNAMLDNWMETQLAASGLQTVKKVRMMVQTNWKESMLALRLREIQNSLDRDIQLGSYPQILDDGSSHVILSVIGPESRIEKLTKVIHLLKLEFDATEMEI